MDLPTFLDLIRNNFTGIVAVGAVTWVAVSLIIRGVNAYRAARAWVRSIAVEAIPAGVKQALTNGGGDIIRTIVRTENQIQTNLHHMETRQIVEDAIKRHEEVEEAKLGRALEDFRAEITDSLELKKRGRR